MSEEEVIKRVENNDKPLTISSLKASFRILGVKSGMVLLVHSSLSSLGWVCGDAVAVILALEEILGKDGTLVMPTFSGNLSEPSKWVNPPVPKTWWSTIRKEMPPYNPELTPTRGMGVIPETFRKQDGVLRSNHPQVSFAARGRYANKITQDHSLEYALGEDSPLARIYDLNGWIMLLGVDHFNNTSIHLAEYRSKYPNKIIESAGTPIMVNGYRRWRELKDIKPDYSDFNEIGSSFEMEYPSRINVSKVGAADTRLFSQRILVDYAINWMSNNRNKE